MSLRLGVAVLVTDASARLLLGRRGKEPNYGKWVIPGGGVRFGERCIDAARREIREETGLEVEPLTESVARPYVIEVLGENEHRVILCVQARLVGGGLQASSDLLEARFFAREDIPIAELSPVIRPVLHEFRWLAQPG